MQNVTLRRFPGGASIRVALKLNHVVWRFSPGVPSQSRRTVSRYSCVSSQYAQAFILPLSKSLLTTSSWTESFMVRAGVGWVAW